MENKIEIIECDGLQIACSLEAHQQEEHPEFHPFNILIYMERGKLILPSTKNFIPFHKVKLD